MSIRRHVKFIIIFKAQHHRFSVFFKESRKQYNASSKNHDGKISGWIYYQFKNLLLFMWPYFDQTSLCNPNVWHLLIMRASWCRSPSTHWEVAAATIPLIFIPLSQKKPSNMCAVSSTEPPSHRAKNARNLERKSDTLATVCTFCLTERACLHITWCHIIDTHSLTVRYQRARLIFSACVNHLEPNKFWRRASLRLESEEPHTLLQKTAPILWTGAFFRLSNHWPQGQGAAGAQVSRRSSPCEKTVSVQIKWHNSAEQKVGDFSTKREFSRREEGREPNEKHVRALWVGTRCCGYWISHIIVRNHK